MPLALLLVAGAATGQPSILGLTPTYGSFNCEGTWPVDLTINADTNDLRGFSLVVEYDANVIKPLSVQVGTLVAGAPCPNFLNWVEGVNSVALDVANLGCSVAGPGTVLTIVFEGVVSGTSAIGVRSGLMRTGTNEPISFTSAPVSVEFDCAVATEAMAWGVLKACYR